MPCKRPAPRIHVNSQFKPWNRGSLTDKRNAHYRYTAWSQVAGRLTSGPME
jgi:hypothetical protein